MMQAKAKAVKNQTSQENGKVISMGQVITSIEVVAFALRVS